MATPSELYGPGLFPAGSDLGAAIKFTDDIEQTETGKFHLWTGAIFLHRTPSPSTTRTFGLSTTSPLITELGFVDSCGLLIVSSTSVTLGRSQGKAFMVRFSASTAMGDGDFTGLIHLSINDASPGLTVYWVRGGRLTCDASGYSQDQVIQQYDFPVGTGPATVTVGAPRVEVRHRTRAVSVIKVFQERTTQTSTREHVYDGPGTAAPTKIRVAKAVTVQSGMRIRVSAEKIIQAVSRMRVAHEVTAGAQTLTQVRNHFAKVQTQIRVGRTVTTAAGTKVSVTAERVVQARCRLQVSFITVEQMKTDMQIQFGADMALATETFAAVPLRDGVAFQQHLKFALIEPGSESVKRNGLAADPGMFRIDHTRGRFAWQLSSVDAIEISYRHSVSNITDENITASIIKATAFISEHLKSGVDVGDPRFVRGGIELAMSFLMDVAIWNVINSISDFASQSKRIDFLSLIKRDFERRAYETLGPFIHEPVPGRPRRAALARPKAIRVYEG